MILNSQFNGTREELEAYVESMRLTLMYASQVETGEWLYAAMKSSSPERSSATLSHERGDQCVTVLLRKKRGVWSVAEALDEEGNPAILTSMGHVTLRQRAEQGEDETGI